MKRVVILLSGGIDSTTVLALAKSEGYDIHALSFDYGQRHRVELELACINAKNFGVRKHIIISFSLREFGGSALTSDIDVPKNRQGLIVKRDGSKNTSHITSDIPVTYVPARNTIFLSFALAWAETIDAPDIFIGANVIDYSGYPDCRSEFLKAFEYMANLATKSSVEGKMKFKIHAPLIKLTKADIIKKGVNLGVDYSLTWSCYDPQPALHSFPKEVINNSKPLAPDPKLIPCMKCDSCQLRAKGFKEAGIEDPLIHKVKHNQ